jgi:hypothetical protein
MGKYILIYPSVHVSNLLFTNNILYFKMFYQYINVNFIYIFNFCFFFFFKMQPNRKVTTVPFRKTLLGKHTRNETSK